MASSNPCYQGNTSMTVLDVITQNLCQRRVENLIAGRHMIYSSSQRDFVPLIHNAIVSPIDHYFISGSGFLESNNDDIFKRKFIPVKNYLLVTPMREPVLIGSSRVKTVSLSAFKKICNDTALIWIENEPINLINSLDI
jgi:hypothetical protein